VLEAPAKQPGMGPDLADWDGIGALDLPDECRSEAFKHKVKQGDRLFIIARFHPSCLAWPMCILTDTMLDFAEQYTKESAKSGLQLARYWPLALRGNSLELAQKRSDADKPKKEGEPVGPMLHVRGPAPGLPSPPKRDGKVAVVVIESD
jgi:hypothetical protein